MCHINVGGNLVPKACNPCRRPIALDDTVRRALSEETSWQDLLASLVSSQFDLLQLPRIAPEPGDFENHGGDWLPSMLIHTRDHLHADGKVRIAGLKACQMEKAQLPRIATQIVSHLIRIDALHAQLSDLVKSIRRDVVGKFEGVDHLTFRSVLIDEVQFIAPEHTSYGREEVNVYVTIRFAIRGMGAIPSQDEITINCRLGQKPGYGRLDRMLERIERGLPRVGRGLVADNDSRQTGTN